MKKSANESKPSNEFLSGNELNFTQVPKSLIDEIRAGNCVAFVGAGFTAPAIPVWSDLLKKISQHPDVSEDTRQNVTSFLDPNDNPHELLKEEAAAQLLETALDSDLPRVISEIIKTDDQTKVEEIQSRIYSLERIPFRAILTTNFDSFLTGDKIGPKSYGKVLREETTDWVSSTDWDSGKSQTPIINLHGRVNGDQYGQYEEIVLSKSAYRRLLFERSDYENFLKALLATRTVLFLGYSFSDSYLNLLRTEIFTLFDNNPEPRPTAFAVMNDLSQPAAEYLHMHEGIYPITYASTSVGTENEDHSKFDAILTEIANRAGVEGTLSEIHTRKRILWLDPKPRNNTYAVDVLSSTSGGPTIEYVGKLIDAIDMLTDPSLPEFDLVISHWGYDNHVGENLLKQIRNLDVAVPVIIFASGFCTEVNRPTALSLGAFDYVSSFEGLFSTLKRLFNHDQ